MKAVIQDRYGTTEVITVDDVPNPVPADDEVLIQVRAASLNGSDRENLAGRPYYARMAGLRRPRDPVPGSDIAGVVVAAGASVTEYAPGEEVFGELPGYRGDLAEYVTTTPKLLARKPPGLSFQEAVAIPQAGGIALRATSGLRPGERVLVNGAGGAGGALVIGLARHLGATVTAVDRADKADHLLRLGAEETIDFETRDWTAHLDRYDRIVDLIAHRSPYRASRALRRGGTYLIVGGHTRVLLATLTAGPPIRWTTGKRVEVLAVPQSRSSLEAVTALIADGSASIAIDRTYSLTEAHETFRRLVSGDNRGKIIIEVS